MMRKDETSLDEQDELFLKHAEKDLQSLQGTMVLNQLEQAKLLQESALAGGPSSLNASIPQLMYSADVGIRTIAALTGVKRVKLKKMLDGEIDIPPDVFDIIVDTCRKKKPSLFE